MASERLLRHPPGCHLEAANVSAPADTLIACSMQVVICLMHASFCGVAASSRTASVDSLMHALLGIGRLMRQRGQGETLDTGSFWLLKTLAASGPLRVTDLAVCANLDASTVSRHVAQLHSAGLIERTPDPSRRARPPRQAERRRRCTNRGRAALSPRSAREVPRVMGSP